MNKPPIGAKPYWLIYPDRIKELAETIQRFCDCAHDLAAPEAKGYYTQIGRFATEVAHLAKLMEDMEATYE